MSVKIINLGAIITDIIVPDHSGNRANVVLGFANLADYEAKNPDYEFGAVVGRYAGRIAGARFSVGGQTYRLAANDGPNTLHGGPGGTSRQVWRLTPFRKGRLVGALLRLDSPEGSQGFPGRLAIDVRYTLSPDNSLRIDYKAVSDRPSVVNLTNHSYFNLAGAGSGTVLNHRLQLLSDRIAETSSGGIPTGRFLPVAGTPFDFRRPAQLAAKIDQPHPQMTAKRGYNHSWVLQWGGELRPAAKLFEPESKRTMEVLTTEPAITVYTGNYFSGRDEGAQGTPYAPLDGIALETMHLSDSPNQPSFPSTIVRPDRPYRSTTILRFGTSR